MESGLTLPMPDALPSELPEVEARLRDLLGALPHDYDAAMTTGPEAARIRADLLAWAGGHLGQGGDPGDTEARGSGVHDRFFHVARAAGDAAELLAGALLVSDLLVMDDLASSGSTLDADPDNMLLGVTGFLTGLITPAAKVAPWGAADDVAAADHRWLVGHQRFFVQLQLLVVVVRQLHGAESAMRQAETVQTFGWLCRSAALSMRYAADFPAALYEIVRDTMTPPAVNAGFSGLQTRDHHALVVALRRLKKDGVIDALTPATGRALNAAMTDLYDAHLWVCDRFGGSEGPSLLMEQASTPETGVASAEKLARQRLRLIARD